MRSVSIKLLKNRLSEYIRLAAAGETVLVTDRDRVVAELGPPAPDWIASVRMHFSLMLFNRDGSSLPCRLPEKRQKGRVIKLSELLHDLQQDRADRRSKE